MVPITKNEKIEQLILAIKHSGDVESLKELFNLTKNDVFSYSLFVAKNKEDAEDMVQETFIKIYDAAKSYKSGNALAWMFTIARNTFLMKKRKNKKIISVDEEFFQNIPTNNDLSIEEKLTLKSAMNVLNDEERQIVSLYISGGFKHREIAEIMNIKLSTILSKYNRALKKLEIEITKGEETDERN